MAFQIALAARAVPLFNKLTPLPDGSLRGRLLQLAELTRFRAKSIQVMDDKRSLHSNAFFMGSVNSAESSCLSTLLAQLSEIELHRRVAHEIGHYKKRHIPKMLLISALRGPSFGSFPGTGALHRRV